MRNEIPARKESEMNKNLIYIMLGKNYWRSCRNNELADGFIKIGENDKDFHILQSNNRANNQSQPLSQ